MKGFFYDLKFRLNLYLCNKYSELKKFIIGRIHSIKYTLIGLWRLISKEHSFQVQLVIVLLFTILGFYFKLTTTEWMFQIFALGIILITEAVNTAIEEVCNFIHPDHHLHIGEIKNIASGAVLIAAITSKIVLVIIYLPKILA